jgi:glutamate racemase
LVRQPELPQGESQGLMHADHHPALKNGVLADEATLSHTKTNHMTQAGNRKTKLHYYKSEQLFSLAETLILSGVVCDTCTEDHDAQ